jgi:hypothetical protein
MYSKTTGVKHFPTLRDIREVHFSETFGGVIPSTYERLQNAPLFYSETKDLNNRDYSILTTAGSPLFNNRKRAGICTFRSWKSS